MMIVPSSPPLAIRLSSGDTATESTLSLCPLNGPPTNVPCSTSQIRRVLSCEAVTIRRPSLKNATADTFSCAFASFVSAPAGLFVLAGWSALASRTFSQQEVGRSVVFEANERRTLLPSSILCVALYISLAPTTLLQRGSHFAPSIFHQCLSGPSTFCSSTSQIIMASAVLLATHSHRVIQRLDMWPHASSVP
ncbi:hypothetical protein DFJ58DRAFT_33198 [Suillus subalutaceus]|uniref:uncharacterized protein n=1 Tax=Suillus subalutaceus TaxID=48586 RepID=UPI001B86C203|nr:uncharacterized protein DFJ58DRAFT_33198 [Suillus subalutaceus]KAG1843916.1 hypothetical protein DFJ58DRAFT_33198 [Suillus subalutaceus]